MVAQDIAELLAQLPIQPEILQLERALKRPDRLPLSSLAAVALPPRCAAAMERIPQLTGFFNPIELITIDDVARAQRERPLHPSFTYRRSTARLNDALRARGLTLERIEGELRRLREELALPLEGSAELVRTALVEKIEDDLATIDLVRGLCAGDDAEVKRAFGRKYGSGVDRALHRAAEVVYDYLVATRAHAKPRSFRRGRIDPELARDMHERLRMSAHELADAVRWMLERYDTHHRARTGRPIPDGVKFRVEVDSKYSSIDVRDKSSEGPIIGIPLRERSYKQVLEVLRHEIDQHVRQSLNGQLMFRFGGGGLKIDEETWYEGLAKHREIQFTREMFGDESSPALPYYTFAIRMADEGKSFVEVLEAICEMRLAAGSGAREARANAWNTAYRVFRGHSDPANGARFGLAKDLAYLRGWMLEAQLDARGLGHLAEAAISRLGGIEVLARFDFGPSDLLFPDLNLTERYFEEVMRPRLVAGMDPD